MVSNQENENENYDELEPHPPERLKLTRPFIPSGGKESWTESVCKTTGSLRLAGGKQRKHRKLFVSFL